MTPPWLNDDDALVGVGGDDALAARRATRARSDSADSAPGMTSQRCSMSILRGERVALGDALAVELALPLAEVDLAQVGLDPRLDAEAGGQRAPRSGPCGAAW